VAAEFQELKTDDNTSLDSSKKTFKRGGENRGFESGSLGSTFGEERPWKKAKGIQRSFPKPTRMRYEALVPKTSNTC